MQGGIKREGETVTNTGTVFDSSLSCRREERGPTVRCYFEAPEICNEKFKLQERGGEKKKKKESRAIHLALHTLVGW